MKIPAFKNLVLIVAAFTVGAAAHAQTLGADLTNLPLLTDAFQIPDQSQVTTIGRTPPPTCHVNTFGYMPEASEIVCPPPPSCACGGGQPIAETGWCIGGPDQYIPMPFFRAPGSLTQNARRILTRRAGFDKRPLLIEQEVDGVRYLPLLQGGSFAYSGGKTVCDIPRLAFNPTVLQQAPVSDIVMRVQRVPGVQGSLNPGQGQYHVTCSMFKPAASKCVTAYAPCSPCPPGP